MLSKGAEASLLTSDCARAQRTDLLLQGLFLRTGCFYPSLCSGRQDPAYEFVGVYPIERSYEDVLDTHGGDQESDHP